MLQRRETWSRDQSGKRSTRTKGSADAQGTRKRSDHATTAPLSRYQELTKRALDVLVASVTLTAFAPLLLLIAAVIKLTTGGPALFLQRRIGCRGEVFQIWKFRTMHVAEDGDVVTQARQADPRLTRVGAILRKYNLDELPQLINVITGDMSLVGPRPHALTHDLMFERGLNSYARRRRVKPGITGWAQINGHRGRISSPADLRNRVACDLYYIRNYSLLFDIYILVRTLSPSAFRNAV